jgi:glycosyltransferase involved in cell wall biosynthesis
LGKVSLVIASSEDIDQESLDRTRNEFDVRYIARVKPYPLKNYRERIRFELDPLFLNTHFSAVSEHDREIVLQVIQEYDVIWVHTVRTANDFRIYRWPRTVVDIDDIQSRFYVSSVKTNSGITRSLLDYRMSLIWRRREGLLKNRFDVIAVCSENDRRYLENAPRIHVVPNGFAPSSQVPDHTPAVPVRIGFIGLLNYMPNRTGIDWFIRKIWPRIKRDAPDARLRLVGRDGDKGLPGMGPDIDGLGYVDNPTDEIATWSAMIIPIQVGGGTRVKIAEAFSRKCPVVSTTLGAFGYDVHDGEELLLADNPEKFAEACIRLMTDRALGERLSKNALRRFLREWTWDSIGESVERAVQTCLIYNESKGTKEQKAGWQD